MQEILWPTQADFPILATLQLLPLAAMVMSLLLHNSRLLFSLALGVAIVELLLAISLYHNFDIATSQFQFAEHLHLIGPFNYHAAVDGIGVIFVLLTVLLSLLVILYGRIRIFEPQSRYFAILFAVESILISSVVTVDLLWFVLLSLLQLIPVSFLLHRWSTSPEKQLALNRFLQFMGTAMLMLLVGTVMLGWQFADANGGHWSFDLFELAAQPVPSALQSSIFFLLFYGMAIRIPIFPLHGWLPTIAEHGTVSIAPVFLIGIKTGVYGLLRFVLPLLPEAVMQWHAYVVAFAVAGVFYAALLALMQVNLRRLLAFAVISHSGLLIIGIFSLNHAAFQGSIMLSINFGLATAGLLFMTGMVFRRTNTLLLERLGGMFDRIPLIGVTFFLAGLSIIGMPGTPGFDSVHLVLEASIHRYGALVTIAAALGNVVAAGFLLWAFQRAFLAAKPEDMPEITTISTPERAVVVIMLTTLLATGFYSEPWLELIDMSLTNLSNLYSH
jgi:NADH-quinone oxidoreductase subunit M